MVLRLLQGVSAGGVSVLTKVILVDLYPDKQALAKKSGILSILYSLSPIVAPVVGGYLQTYFNWQANFYFLMVYAVVGLVLALSVLSETLAEKKHFQFKQMLQSFAALLANKTFLVNSFSWFAAGSSLFLYATIAPFFVQKVLHKTPLFYGHLTLFMGLAFLFGGVLNRLLLRWFNIRTMIYWGFSCAVCSAIAMLLLGLFRPPGLIAFAIPMLLLMSCISLIAPNVRALNMSAFRQQAGMANALMGALVVTTTGLATGLASSFTVHTMVPLALFELVLMGIGLILFAIA